MYLLLITISLPILTYLSFAVFYHVFLAVICFVLKEKDDAGAFDQYKYQVLIPAHNEELLIGRLLESLDRIEYDDTLFRVTVIADNCTDKTAAIVSENSIDVIIRHDTSQMGKGFAIEWALGTIDISEFDAIVIIDADSIVDPHFFQGLNEVVSRGFDVVQCNNNLANPDKSAFTRLMYLSRTIGNELYHHAKYKLGLSSFLMGNGMCFTRKILKKYGWATSTMAEDYEYYAKLIKQNVMIGYAINAKLYHQESIGVHHATSQRLRWSSGRFQVASTYGLDLLKKGWKKKQFKIIDASFPLVLPNLSLMVNITVLALVVALIINYLMPIFWLLYWLICLFILEIAYFFTGVYLTRMSILKLFFALCYAPIFLFWKGYIDSKAILGKKVREWGESKRL